MTKKIAIIAALLVVTGAACKDSDADRERDPNAVACVSTPSPIAGPKFPTPFPEIDDVTWTSNQTAGPTQVIQGYTGDALGDLFGEMKEKFDGNGFSVAKSERDPHDAEVNFEGAKNNGQVRLAEECQGRTAVTISIRPK
ncbi:MAG: hypothetical protein ABR552_01970 [Actinomycetota bacterium]